MIPPETQWGHDGERGDCPGRRRSDGMCGAFAPRDEYEAADP